MGSAKGDPSAYGFHESYLDTFHGTGSIAQALYICLSSSVLQTNGKRGRHSVRINAASGTPRCRVRAHGRLLNPSSGTT
jgi:hypothetical protein